VVRPPAHRRAGRPPLDVHGALRRARADRHRARPHPRGHARARPVLRARLPGRGPPGIIDLRPSQRGGRPMRTLDRSTPPGPGALRPFHLPEVHRDTLPNGLTVITARRGRMPIVTAALIVEGGPASELAHLAGVAHLTARA